MEIGSPEKIYDSVTAALDTAEKQLFDIIAGKKVPSPSRYQDLLTYYDVYMREIQKVEIMQLLPEIHDPGGKGIGNRILDQIAAIEKLLLEIIQEKGDLPVFSPELGATGVTLTQIIFGKYPSFPAVYKADPVQEIDPFEIENEAIVPQNPNPDVENPINLGS